MQHAASMLVTLLLILVSCTPEPSCEELRRCASEGCKSADECTNSQPADCNVSCDQGQCVTKAQDADLDGHGSAACSAAPGDDCDDADAASFIGAFEVCDGIDNDCDGKPDLAGGPPIADLTVIDATQAVEPDIAWSPTAALFGVVWVSDGLQFVGMDTAGKFANSAQRITPVGVAATAPRIAWGEGYFGIAWRGQGSSIFLSRIGVDGKALSGDVLVALEPGEPELAWLGDRWLVVWSSGDALRSRTISADGTLITEVVTLVAPAVSVQAPRIASLGTSAEALWVVPEGLRRGVIDVKPSLADVDWIPPFPSSTSDQALAPVLGAGSAGVAAAWAGVEDGMWRIHASELLDGVVRCRQPISAASSFPSDTPASMVVHASGAALVYWEEKNLLRLATARLDGKCNFSVPISVTEAGGAGTRIAGIAASSQGFAVVWDEGVTPNTSVAARIFGASYCD